jgi:hypothetical protein
MATGRCRKCKCHAFKRKILRTIVVTTPILVHKNGHYVRPNKVALKYLYFKKDVDLNVHVRVFNFVIKTNVETSKKYIINVFNYMLRDTTSSWCHIYMSEYFFRSLPKHFANIIRRLKMMSKYTWS